jgi:exodeoxyribonuclease V gamma subunit
MPGLHLHRSNRLDVLAECLAEVLRTPLRSVLQPEIVAVQSVGMRRWLALRLSEELGVTMNCEFPFPATLAHSIFRGAFPELDDSAPFARDAVLWRTLSALPAILMADGAAPLRTYLEGENTALKAYQLSAQVAAVFDRYLLHRAETLMEWQLGEGGDWQGGLWRELIRGHEQSNPPALLHRLIQRNKQAPAPLQGIPERLSVFGVSSLSPFYTQLLSEAAASVDIHLFLFEPTPEYTGDTQSPKEQDRFMRRVKDTAARPEDFHLDTGNPLLASMGKPSRAFSRILAELPANTFDERFEPPADRTLIESIRSDIFHLRDRRTEGEPVASISVDDRSVQIHCCHGPMREVEVLYDHLLDLMERHPDMAPKDILVMTPDIETYAPFVEAVFGCPEDDALRIPYTIADRRLQMEAPLAQHFATLLDLHGSRFTASAVLGLLEFAPVRDRFEIAERDLEVIREWVDRAAIRWGIDSAHRESFALPAFQQNSWRAGFERLLLGYAMPGDGRHLFHDILPVAEVEGGRAAVLGQFVDLCEKLFMEMAGLSLARTLPEWAETFRSFLVMFFAETDETAEELTRVRAVLDAIEAAGEYYVDEVPLEVIRSHLMQALADSDSGLGFLAGHTTFCSLKPMRSVPFRVICVLGLNDSAFPRHDSALAFDLVAADARPGDRSRRDDDRQLFLETILSAGDVLYLSYSGLSLRDQSESPPSVVVSELLDYIEANYEAIGAGLTVRGHLVTKHRLQPFSPAYFRGDARLFSFSRENSHASGTRSARDGSRAPFVDQPLPAGTETIEAVSLEELAAFLCHSSRTFIRERVGIRLSGPLDEVEDREPIALDALQRTQLCEEIIRWRQEQQSPDQLRAVLRASGRLPIGWAGDEELHKVEAEADSLLRRIDPLRSQDSLPPLEVDLQVGAIRMSGYLPGIRPSGAVRFRGAKLKARDLLRGWVNHLAMLATNADGYPERTTIFGTDREVTLGPVADPQVLLSDLLQLFLLNQCEPVALFPETSLAYAMKAISGAGTEKWEEAMSEALKHWDGAGYTNGPKAEKDDEYIRLCIRGIENPLDERWIDHTMRVFGPLIESIVAEEIEE